MPKMPEQTAGKEVGDKKQTIIIDEEGEVDLYVSENSLPLPKYFAELYDQFEELKRYDLKDVIYDRAT